MIGVFKRLFNKSTESTTNIKEVVIPYICEGKNEHCDLVLQLHKLQDRRKEINNEIQDLENNSSELINDFINFLYEFEKRGLHMGYFDASLKSERNINIIEWTLQEQSSADIFRVTEELKTYKNKDDIICEKRRALKTVEDNIKDIKSKLGIE